MSKQQILYGILLLAVHFNEKTCEHTQKTEECLKAAQTIYHLFADMFVKCIKTPIPDKHFLMDDLKSFANYPAKTTVGFAPKFTNNRKFFANMISSHAFKDMLARDEEELRIEIIKKTKYCQEVVMDPNLLKEFYDREVDQTNI